MTAGWDTPLPTLYTPPELVGPGPVCAESGACARPVDDVARAAAARNLMLQCRASHSLLTSGATRIRMKRRSFGLLPGHLISCAPRSTDDQESRKRGTLGCRHSLRMNVAYIFLPAGRETRGETRLKLSKASCRAGRCPYGVFPFALMNAPIALTSLSMRASRVSSRCFCSSR